MNFLVLWPKNVTPSGPADFHSEGRCGRAEGKGLGPGDSDWSLSSITDCMALGASVSPSVML